MNTSCTENTLLILMRNYCSLLMTLLLSSPLFLSLLFSCFILQPLEIDQTVFRISLKHLHFYRTKKKIYYFLCSNIQHILHDGYYTLLLLLLLIIIIIIIIVIIIMIMIRDGILELMDMSQYLQKMLDQISERKNLI